MTQNQAVQFSIENQKRSLEIKYLLQQATQTNQEELVAILNKLYPFTKFPLERAPPIELIQTDAQKKLMSKKVSQQLEKYSFIVVSGCLCVQKRQHQFIQNRFLSTDTQQQIFFNLKNEDVALYAMPNSCTLRIHNVWIQMAKKRLKSIEQSYIKTKLFQIDFFANLSFEEFQKCCQKAYIAILGPGQSLLNAGETPYHMYIVSQGQLACLKRVRMLKDDQLWSDFKHQLHRQGQNICQQMLDYLIKQPKSKEDNFEVEFRIKSYNQGKVICGRETLLQQKLTYSICSTLKTKVICLKYPDFYVLSADKLSEVRTWPDLKADDKNLRKDYYYQKMWENFKQNTKKQSKLNKMEKQKFEDFLRKKVNMNLDKSYYCANKIGQGSVIDNSAGKVSKLKFMAYQQ